MKTTKNTVTSNKVNNKTREENTMKVTWTTKQGNTSTRELNKTQALLRTKHGYTIIDAYSIKGYDDLVIQQTNKGYRLILVGTGTYINKKNGNPYYKSLESACQYGIRHALKVKRDNIELYNKQVIEQSVKGFLLEYAEIQRKEAEKTEKKPVKSTKKATKKVDKKAKATKKVEKKSQPDFVGKTYKVNTKTWKTEEVKGYGEGFAEALRAGFAF